MSFGALYLIKERSLQRLAVAGGIVFISVAAIARFTHKLAPDETHLVLLIPLIVGISMLSAGLLLKIHGLRVYFVGLLLVLGPGFLVISWLACATGLLSKASCG